MDSDLIITYSSNYMINRSILKYAKMYKIKCAACVVEWYSDDYFGNKERERKKYCKTFYNLFEQYDLLFPISTLIEKHFIERGARVYRLPILCDTEEYLIKEKKFEKKLIFYPANGKMKDALNDMLKSFSLLSRTILERVEIHITGVSMERIKEVLSGEEFERIKKSLRIHKWMTYNELSNLYNVAHYLLLAREINQMTLANFPSKVPEVMCYGVVPIVSKVGDYTELLLHNGVNSFVFDGCKPEDIASTLEHAVLLEEEDYRKLSSNALASVKNQLDYRNWSLKLREEIEKIFQINV